MAITNFNLWSEEELITALKKVDKELRPIIIYVNPHDEQLLRKALGDMIERVIIKPCDIVEIGKAYAFNRDYIKSLDPLNFTEEV